MKIKQLAHLTIIEHEDGSNEAVITSHPDGNMIEEMLKETVKLLNIMIKNKLERRQIGPCGRPTNNRP
jgi:hypothetical protein